MSTVDIARSPLPEDAERYEGRWIAIRDSEVIADAESFEELIQLPDVMDTDVLYRVPERGTYFY